MKKKIMTFLLILATFLVAGLASADTLDEGNANKIADLTVETVVPEKVTVKVVMPGGTFKIGDKTYQEQGSVVLPYASDLTVTPVNEEVTKADLDFAKVTPVYQIDAGALKVSKIRTDGTITLTYKKVLADTNTQGAGAANAMPKTSDTERVWISLVGLAIVVSLFIIASKRRRSDKDE